MVCDKRRIGLVGCVSKKRSTPQAARNLYASTLFSGRRSYVEHSCSEWWILSAEHHLVHPSEILTPYDLALKELGRAERRFWSRQVLSAIDERIRPDRGDTFEVHAGGEYRDFGLSDGLRERGCSVELPTEGQRIGEQLRFYKQARESKI